MLSKKKGTWVLTLLIMFFISSCGMLPNGSAAVDYKKDNQENSSSSTNNGNGTGRDANLNLKGVISGDDVSKNFNNSNIKSDDKNASNNNDNEAATGSKNVLGNLEDNSQNQTTSNSSTTSNSDTYQNSTIHNCDSDKWYSLALTGWICAILGWFLPSPTEIINFFRRKSKDEA